MSRPSTRPLEPVRIFRFVLAVFGIVFLVVFGYKAAISADDITAVGGKTLRSVVSIFTAKPESPEVVVTNVSTVPDVVKLPEADSSVSNEPVPPTGVAPETKTNPGTNVKAVNPSVGQGVSGKKAIRAENNNATPSVSGNTPSDESSGNDKSLSSQIGAVLHDVLVLP